MVVSTLSSSLLSLSSSSFLQYNISRRVFLGFLALNLVLSVCYNDNSVVIAQQSRNVVFNVNEHSTESQDPDFDNEVMLTDDIKFLWRNPTGAPNNKGDNSQYFIARFIHTTKGNDAMLAPTWLGFGIIDGGVDAVSKTTTTTEAAAATTEYNMQGSIAIIGEERLDTVRKFTLGGSNHKIGDGVVQSLPMGQQTLGTQSKIEQVEYYDDENSQGGSRNNVIETVLDFQKLYVEPNLNENPEPIILKAGNNVFMYAVGPSRNNPGFGVHSKAGYFLLDLDNTKTQEQIQGIGGEIDGDSNEPFDTMLGEIYDNDNNSNNANTNNKEVNVENVYSVYDIVNATRTHDDFLQGDYHHQVTLQDGLIFQWRDVIFEDDDDSSNKDANMFIGRLIHRTERIENSAIPTNPSWIGFGWLDTINNPNPPIDGWTLIMDGSESIIGAIDNKNDDGNNDGWVYKYRLGGQHTTGGMIQRYPDQQQTLRMGTVVQTPDVVGYWTTILTFEKLIVEPNKTETPLRTKGENVFLWAIGPSYNLLGDDSSNTNLGTHTSRGGFVLDFDAVQRKNNEIVDDTTDINNNDVDDTNDYDDDNDIDESLDLERDIFGTVNATAYVTYSALPEYDYEVNLQKNLIFAWKDLDDDEDILYGQLIYTTPTSAHAPQWIGFGFNGVDYANRATGYSLEGSNCIIGSMLHSHVLKYPLGPNHGMANQMLPYHTNQQTLVQDSTSVQRQVVNGLGSAGSARTTLEFGKLLQEASPDEPVIRKKGDNIFLWAMGPSSADASTTPLNTDPAAQPLGVHTLRGQFRLDFQQGKRVAAEQSEPSFTFDTVTATDIVTYSSYFNYDYEVQLNDNLKFVWKDIDDDNILNGKLVWTTETDEDAPTWIGFGTMDVIAAQVYSLDGSDCIIGSLLDYGVLKYPLGVNHGMVDRMVPYPARHQTLFSEGTSVRKQVVPGNGKTETILEFEKLMIEESPEEPIIIQNGENFFLWAIGPPAGDIDEDDNGGGDSSTLGVHLARGSFRLDFVQASRIAAETPEFPQSTPSSSNMRTELESQENAIPAPVVHGMCYSRLFERSGRSVELTPNLEMHWRLNLNDQSFDSPFGGEGTGLPSISIILVYKGRAWLGVGFSKGESEKVHKPGTVSIIGLPNTANSPQLKYNISDPDNIFAVSDQTLIESHVSQDNDETTLRFEKALTDGFDEATISSSGFNTLSYAIGHDNELGYHKHRGVFRINFSQCMEPQLGPPTRRPTNKPTEFDEDAFIFGGLDDDEINNGQSYENPADINPISTEHEVDTHGAGALTAHGLFAVMAWALAMPFAVTSAWFRTLVPTSWIYFHVFGNVATFFFTFVAIMLGVGAVGLRPSSHHFSKGHHVVGMILFSLVTIQVINGFFRPPVVKPMTNDNNGVDIHGNPIPSTNDEYVQPPGAFARQIWHMIHRALGWIMLILALYQIHTGLMLFIIDFEINNVLIVIFWIYVAFFATFCVVFKLWLLLEHPNSHLSMDGRQNAGDGQLGGSLAGRQMEDDDEDLSFSDDVDLSDDDDYGINNSSRGGGSGGLRNSSERSGGSFTKPQIT